MNMLTVTVIFALVATLGVLFWGVGSMAHGGSYDREHGEQIMFVRVAVQAVAFALIVIALVLSFF